MLAELYVVIDMTATTTSLLKVARFLDDCEFQDYINGAGLWSTKDDHASGEAIISSWKIGSSLRDGLLRHSGSVGVSFAHPQTVFSNESIRCHDADLV